MATHPISIDSAGGEYMESVLVISWAVKSGDPVKAGDLLVTVETAKAATEIEADRDGWLAEIFFAEGQEAPVGAVLGTIADEKPIVGGKPIAGQSASIAPATATAVEPNPREPVASEAPSSIRPPGSRAIASPLARRLAAAAELDLATISGSGPHGRIKKRDIDAALAARSNEHDGAVQRTTAVKTSSVAAPALARQTVPVVLIHGFGADSSVWRQVVPLLGTGIETISLDLPGHGAEAAKPARSIEEIAFLLSDRLEEMGVGNAHLVGHSLGGAAALALARLGHLAVRSVTLLAPGGLGPEINAGFIAGLARATTAQALERWLTVMVGDPSALPVGYAQAALRQMEKTGNRDALAAMAESLFPDGTQGFDLTGALAAVAVPTRLIWGRLDRVIPVAHAVRAPGFTAVHLLDGVGHVPQIEAPALTARLITETVRSAG
ncbi:MULTISPECIES: acetoin dehydrogenase dihydrolipoyllysine-residue acetyltransferase subunit [unclassified Mesorhizobium]|uniref:acetoin dehydrogenase dihydrolipoyllysine-residue acetyltransferase subunit n=1 Tax=unclassified Mesorhizobium TaxID=325217 RepID=UPI000FCA6CDF|nr:MULTISPECIES: acetoin dehydrogenase dihydrolipoyllysine-residue acetyltransferase subunit [unclassified Mesorhizobium]RUX92346.1 acetoin dehydrogenase dihydrolipoyllysine-residue acetyltransferase subunit [Mesorhizobium sp. M7D.F.Ca.US.004.01.2.1]RVA33160.1 acetoin dehydrogenase dihydrolipoyllysine-residue acetyltransferase subunit [Mesorhizobium sp. M7D.F.Ca.US.004.03.1.1]